MTDPTLVPGGGRAALRLRRDLPDPPSVVWQAITEPNQLRAGFPCEVEVAGGRWEVRAAITFRFPPEVIDLTLTGGVVAVNEPTLLVFTWGEETLRFELSARSGGTRLVLIDELPPRIAARNAPGWEVCLERLAGRSWRRCR